MEKNYDNEMKIEFISNPNNEAFANEITKIIETNTSTILVL